MEAEIYSRNDQHECPELQLGLAGNLPSSSGCTSRGPGSGLCGGGLTPGWHADHLNVDFRLQSSTFFVETHDESGRSWKVRISR